MTHVKRRIAVALFIVCLAIPALLPAMARATPQDDLAAAQAQLDSLGQELMSLEESLAMQTTELENTTYEIDETRARIEETSGTLAVARKTLAARMRSSYKSGAATMLGVILGATDIDDFLSRIYYMDKIAEGDAAAISCVKALGAELEAAHARLAERQERQRSAITDINDDIASYQGKVAEALAYYEQLDAEIQAQIEAEAAASADATAGQQGSALTTALTAIQQPEPIVAIEQPDTPSGSPTVVEAPATPAAETPAASVDETPTASVTPSEPAPAPSEPTAPTPTSTASSISTFGGQGVASAYSCIGCPYVWGAAGPSSFDCSGLVCYCYGYRRGRATYNMIASLRASGDWKTSLSELSYGDLVFPSYGHVGIYLGDGMMIHAPLPGRTVCVASVYAFYGGGTY